MGATADQDGLENKQRKVLRCSYGSSSEDDVGGHQGMPVMENHWHL